MYFSVKVPMRIGAKSFKTCICYALPDYLKPTVEKLVAEGKAEVYPENRFFCNGKLLDKPVKKSKKKSVAKETPSVEESVDDSVNGF